MLEAELLEVELDEELDDEFDEEEPESDDEDDEDDDVELLDDDVESDFAAVVVLEPDARLSLR